MTSHHPPVVFDPDSPSLSCFSGGYFPLDSVKLLRWAYNLCLPSLGI